MTDTIFALSSGALPSGVAVIRLSGPLALPLLERLAGALPAPRTVALRTIVGDDAEVIDQALILTFPAPSSFTGEDCAEIHCHGGKAVVARLLAELGRHSGLRHAEAGEFSRRAFLNGKMDLASIEGLADLVSAETEMQRRLARLQASGDLTRIYDKWARDLTRSRALIEAELDFADEADVPGSVSDQVWADVRRIRAEMQAHIDQAGIAEIIRDGYSVVIAGPPNAGKSSLMNHLARRDVAIVTDIAGTTRDVLSIDLDLAGYKVRLSDTAGIRETSDPVEREGVRRSLASVSDADLVLWLSDEARETDHPIETELIRVMTKSDRHARTPPTGDWLPISVAIDSGIGSLMKRIGESLERRVAVAPGTTPIRSRHVELLRQSNAALAASLDDKPLELKAEDLRIAGDRLGRITGRVDVDDLLGVIFSSFCIGK